MGRFVWIINLCLLLLTVRVAAQQAGAGMSIHSQTELRHITSDDGLANNRVLSISQDHDNYIWIATFNGLSRYDGLRFWNYKHNLEDSTSLSLNRVNEVYCDSRGTIWIGTPTTLQTYDPQTDSFRNFKAKGAAIKGLQNIYEIAEDWAGNIWFAAEGLYRYQPSTDSVISFADREDIDTTWLTNVFVDKFGKVWSCGSWNKVYHYDPEIDRFNAFHKTDNGLSVGILRFWVVYQDHCDNIWFGSNDNGAFKLAPNDSVLVNYVPEPTANFSTRVRVFFEDQDNNLFVGTRNGLYKKTANGFMPYANTEHPISNLNHNSVYCSGTDKHGGIWLGTFAGGLSYFNTQPQTFTHYRSIKGDDRFLNDKLVYSILEDEQADVWIGTETGGLNHIDVSAGKVTYYKHDPSNPYSISHNEVRAIVQDRVGNLLVGTNKGGVNYFNRKEGRFYHFLNDPNNPHTLRSNKIHDLFLDDDDKVWVHSLDGLDLLNYKTGYVKRFDINTRGTQRAKDGSLWFGLYEQNHTRGVCRFNNSDSTFTWFDNPTVFTTRTLSLHMDKNDYLWIGFEAGCARFNIRTHEYTFYNHATGYQLELVQAIEEDSDGNLWLSTNNGLVRLGNAVNRPAHPVPTKTFSVKDGLQAREFAPGASFKGKDDKLYFGGVNGFSSFYPNDIIANPYMPDVKVTDLKLFNKSVEVGDTILGQLVLEKPIGQISHLVLNHNHTVFSFVFSAFHYANPLENRFAYKMEGLENTWTYTTGKHNFAGYTSLPGGQYTFLLKAANNDGVWSDKIYSLKLTIQPPWWYTRWAKALAIMLLLLGGAVLFKARIKQLRQQKKQLEISVQKRTQELYEANSSLEKKQEAILRKNQEIVKQNSEIKRQKEFVEDAYLNMQTLSKFGQQVTATLDMDKIGMVVYDHIAELMPIDVLGIGLYSEKYQLLQFVAFIEQGQLMPSFVSKIDDPTSLAAWTLRNKKEVHCANFPSDYKQYISKIKLRTTQVPRSVVNLPLLINQRAIGVLSLQSFAGSDFSNKDLTNMRSISSYLAIAMDNAKAYRTIEQQNANITDSILYAKTIQDAILPSVNVTAGKFNGFVFYRPRDIVSGDFYWSVKLDATNEMLSSSECPNCKEIWYLAVVDCTGHGVPGALMSVVGSRLLSEIVNEGKLYDPASILAELDRSVIKALNQEHSDNDDGMEMSLLKIYIEEGSNKQEMVFAGARTSLYYCRKDQDNVCSIRGNTKSIGGLRYNKKAKQFDNKPLVLHQGDMLYLPTDGFIDQHNSSRKKFGQRRFAELLQRVASLPLAQQQQYIAEAFDVHRGQEEQRDDVTLLAIRI